MNIVSKLFGRRIAKPLAPQRADLARVESHSALPDPTRADENPRICNLADARLAYHLFLGRAPENDEVAEEMVGRSTLDAARSFLASGEFTGRILKPVAEQGEPSEWHGGLPLDHG